MPIDPALAEKLVNHAPDIAAIVLVVLAIVVSFSVAAYRRHKERMRAFGNSRFAHLSEIDAKLQSEVPEVDMGTMLFPKAYAPSHKSVSADNLLVKKM